MNDEIRRLFPVLERYTYLNSAAVSPLPLRSVEATISQLNDVMRHGTTNFQDWVDTKEKARGLAANLLHVRDDQIAFVRNTSDAISCVANGIRWQEGDNIVTFAHEFPSNFYPWRNARDRFGVELRTAQEQNGRIDIDDLCRMIDSNTKVVAISAVQFSTGFRADLKKIAAAAHDVEAIFCVDIIQAFGAIELNLSDLNIDAAAGASHKWLCAPEGCGILYLNDRARNILDPTLVGWVSVEEPWDFVNYEQPLKNNALVFETGTSTASLFYGLESSLRMLRETGINKIEMYLSDLSDQLCEMIPEERYEIVSSRIQDEKSQIVCIRSKNGISSNELFQSLSERDIVVSPRGENLRIAPHFFNNREDIEKLIANLP